MGVATVQLSLLMGSCTHGGVATTEGWGMVMRPGSPNPSRYRVALSMLDASCHITSLCQDNSSNILVGYFLLLHLYAKRILLMF